MPVCHMPCISLNFCSTLQTRSLACGSHYLGHIHQGGCHWSMTTQENNLGHRTRSTMEPKKNYTAIPGCCMLLLHCRHRHDHFTIGTGTTTGCWCWRQAAVVLLLYTMSRVAGAGCCILFLFIKLSWCICC